MSLTIYRDTDTGSWMYQGDADFPVPSGEITSVDHLVEIVELFASDGINPVQAPGWTALMRAVSAPSATNDAERFASLFFGDGQIWHVGDLRFADILGWAAARELKSCDGDHHKYIFADGSCIVCSGYGWDEGFADDDCFCWLNGDGCTCDDA
jgi:hypothetical protein